MMSLRDYKSLRSGCENARRLQIPEERKGDRAGIAEGEEITLSLPIPRERLGVQGLQILAEQDVYCAGIG
jgi:hypothetical protein